MNRLVTALVLTLLAFPAQAATKPSDSVGVINIVTVNGIDNERVYHKPWGQIKIDPKTRTGLTAKSKSLDRSDESFKIGFIFVINDVLRRVVFHGSKGSIHMMDWPTGTECSLYFSGNGGFASFSGKACYEPDEK